MHTNIINYYSRKKQTKGYIMHITMFEPYSWYSPEQLVLFTHNNLQHVPRRSCELGNSNRRHSNFPMYFDTVLFVIFFVPPYSSTHHCFIFIDSPRSVCSLSLMLKTVWLEVIFSIECLATNVTFEWLLSWVYFHVCRPVILPVEAFPTYLTLEWFVSWLWHGKARPREGQ